VNRVRVTISRVVVSGTVPTDPALLRSCVAHGLAGSASDLTRGGVTADHVQRRVEQVVAAAVEQAGTPEAGR
jgi:hypothetical protein